MNIIEIAKQIESVPLNNSRRIIAIAGAPASGKSTLAEALAEQISSAQVVPMDGFHLSNEVLIGKGLLAVKGAPQTFDAAGFVEMVQSLRKDGEHSFPTFDRTNDCVVPSGGFVPASTQTILVEGNYVMLNMPEWKALQPLWDFSIMLSYPMDVLKSRLCARWGHYGHTAEEALERASFNDIPNAKLVSERSFDADLVLDGVTL